MIVVQWPPDEIFVAKIQILAFGQVWWVQTSLMAKEFHSKCFRTAAINLTNDVRAWGEDCRVAWPSISSRRFIHT